MPVPEPVLDDFEADYDADTAPEGNIQPDKVHINVDDFQAAASVDTAGFLARTKGPVVDRPAQRLGLETVTATQDLFPEYLQPGNLNKHVCMCVQGNGVDAGVESEGPGACEVPACHSQRSGRADPWQPGGNETILAQRLGEH